jgi:hypothetical protein
MIVGNVWLHYLTNFRSTVAVEQGIADAREWCRRRGYDFTPSRLWDTERALSKDEPHREPPKGYLPMISQGRFDPRRAPVAAHNEMEMHAPPAHVWNILLHAAGWPRWNLNVKDVSIDGGRANLSAGVGFRWRTLCVGLRSEIKEFVPLSRIAWRTKGFGVEAYNVWLIEPTRGGCRVKTEETRWGLLALLDNWLFLNRVHERQKQWLEALRHESTRRNSSRRGAGA